MAGPAARHGPMNGEEPRRAPGDAVRADDVTADGGQGPVRGGAQDRADLVTELVARLRGAGLDPDAEQVSDALWLAGFARPTGAAPDSDDTGGPGFLPDSSTRARAGAGRTPGSAAADGAQEGPPEERRAGSGPPSASVPGQGDRRVALYPEPPGGGSGGALAIGAPAAGVLPSPLRLQRALRPLQGYRTAAPPLRHVIDEDATADLSARAGGLVIPVFRAVTRRDALLQLVMDASPSMRVWDRMFDELIQVFSQLGAFWDIHPHYLHEGPAGEPVVSRSPEPHAAPLHASDRLNDPTGRRVTVVVSDCAGPLWRSGQAHRLLHRLAGRTPVAVLQPLPQRLWRRTRLPVTPGELARGEGPAAAASLRFSADGPLPPAGSGALPVPVLPPTPGALGGWARLLSGTGAGRVPGAVGWVRADQPAAPPVPPGRSLSALQLISRFRSAASPAAARLAVYLAAAPLSLPVMQLVQRTMLPDSGPSELAEVLLSGLLTRSGNGTGPGESGRPGGGQWYEFAPGVRQALLEPLGRNEALLVLKHCSEYIEQRFGKGGPNFPALAYAQLGEGAYHGRPARAEAASAGDPTGRGEARGPDGLEGSDGPDGTEGPVRDAGAGPAPGVPQPFAEVAADVLERFMAIPGQFATDEEPASPVAGEPHPAVADARDLVAQFDEHGMVQYLMDAVQLLRGATERQHAQPLDAELWAEYARSLLRLWEVQRGRELLAEAEAAAERAVGNPRAVGNRAVLAAVLHASADDRRRRGDRREALAALRRADLEYAVACAAPGLADDEALRLTLERVRALETQWRISGDSTLLQGAVGMLEAFADTWPDLHARPPELALAHGRALLRLSGAGPEGDRSRAYAAQAARSLRTALEPDATAPDMAARDAVTLDTTAPGAPAQDAPTAPPLPAAARPQVLLDLVDALLRSGPEGTQEAQNRVTGALPEVREQRMRSALLIRAGRVRIARYEESGEPGELQWAAERFEEAARGIPRDAAAHADLLAEWGEVLLRRAVLDDGSPGQRLARLTPAVRVLRGCRTETPLGHRASAHRLLLLGRTLMARYRLTGDRVDLREAEHLFGLAAQQSKDPLTGTRCGLELGQARFEAAQALSRPGRLDEAADAFRAASESAQEAYRQAELPHQRTEALRLGAQNHHWRGMTYEAAGRPRAAREAYRSARDEWARLPRGTEVVGEPTPRQTAQRLAELE